MSEVPLYVVTLSPPAAPVVSEATVRLVRLVRGTGSQVLYPAVKGAVRNSPPPPTFFRSARLTPGTDLERIWHIHDSHGQILKLILFPRTQSVHCSLLRPTLGIQPRVKSLRSSYTGLCPQTGAPHLAGGWSGFDVLLYLAPFLLKTRR